MKAGEGHRGVRAVCKARCRRQDGEVRLLEGTDQCSHRKSLGVFGSCATGIWLQRAWCSGLTVKHKQQTGKLHLAWCSPSPSTTRSAQHCPEPLRMLRLGTGRTWLWGQTDIGRLHPSWELGHKVKRTISGLLD